jgi:serine/threonine protein kinase
MADVYRATDHRLGRAVAIKILRDGAGDDSDRARFIGEARTLAMLSHSGLVTVLDAGFGEAGRAAPGPGTVDVPYLVMELVEGPTLARRISEGPLPLDEVGALGVQVAEALAYVHEREVVHRDVKPGNVLLGPDRVKLADFGLARLLSDDTRHTRTGHTIGTAAYLAPEQVTGDGVSAAADVYSFGLVLLEALTGRCEYPGPANEAALARLNRPPVVPQSLDTAWQELLSGMTSLAPADRPDTRTVASVLRDQPTGPIPVATETAPDAETVPLLGHGPVATGGVRTRVLTQASHTFAPSAVPSVIDRMREAVAAGSGSLRGRLRAMPPYQWGFLAAVAALVVFLVVVALAADTGPGPADLPVNTPADLRGPLTDLHHAVNGEG